MRELSTPFDLLDPRHCDLSERCPHSHSYLEVGSATLKVIWVWKFSEIKFHRTILRPSSSSTMRRIPVKIPGTIPAKMITVTNKK